MPSLSDANMSCAEACGDSDGRRLARAAHAGRGRFDHVRCCRKRDVVDEEMSMSVIDGDDIVDHDAGVGGPFVGALDRHRGAIDGRACERRQDVNGAVLHYQGHGR